MDPVTHSWPLQELCYPGSPYPSAAVWLKVGNAFDKASSDTLQVFLGPPPAQFKIQLLFLEVHWYIGPMSDRHQYKED